MLAAGLFGECPDAAHLRARQEPAMPRAMHHHVKTEGDENGNGDLMYDVDYVAIQGAGVS